MIVFYLIIFVLTLIYLYFKYIYTHWERKGVPYIKPTFPFGNLALTAFRKTAFGVNIYELYKKSSEKIVGIYLLFQPALLVRDAEVVKNILVNDFDSFHDRGVYNNPDDPFSGGLFFLPGQKWKTLRAKLTPVFTTGKMKGMLPSIISVGETMQKYVQPMADKGEVVEIKEITTRYAMDAIAKTIFGLDTNVMENPNDSFRTIEMKYNGDNFMSRLRSSAIFLCPKLIDLLHIKSTPLEVQEYMVEIVKKNIEYREKHNIIRQDFINCLIQLRNTGKVSDGDELWEMESVAEDLKSMSIEYCAAQVFLFYGAGFDTSASAVAYALYELSRDRDLMKRLQNEIDKTLKRHNGILTYECMQDMPLLELCVQESVRKYPTLPLLNRICTKDYQVPNSNLRIEKGTPIIISLMGMFRDPEYFPEPMRFMPERYNKDNKLYNPAANIPFGDGPRICIGIRLGKIITKVALILLLQKYNFECLDDKELEFDVFAIGLRVQGGINVKVTNRQDIESIEA